MLKVAADGSEQALVKIARAFDDGARGIALAELYRTCSTAL